MTILERKNIHNEYMDNISEKEIINIIYKKLSIKIDFLISLNDMLLINSKYYLYKDFLNKYKDKKNVLYKEFYFRSSDIKINNGKLYIKNTIIKNLKNQILKELSEALTNIINLININLENYEDVISVFNKIQYVLLNNIIEKDNKSLYNVKSFIEENFKR